MVRAVGDASLRVGDDPRAARFRGRGVGLAHLQRELADGPAAVVVRRPPLQQRMVRADVGGAQVLRGRGRAEGQRGVGGLRERGGEAGMVAHGYAEDVVAAGVQAIDDGIACWRHT